MMASLSLAAAQTDDLLRVLLVVVLVAIGCVGVGTTALLLRVVLPGVATATDRALSAMTGRRLLAAGVLPLIGAALLAQGVALAGNSVLGGAFVLVVALPLTLAWLGGVLAALPYVGARLLRGGDEASPLLRGAVGGLVMGLAVVTWTIPPLGVLVSVLLTGWFLAIGVGAALGARGPAKNQLPDANGA